MPVLAGLQVSVCRSLSPVRPVPVSLTPAKRQSPHRVCARLTCGLRRGQTFRPAAYDPAPPNPVRETTGRTAPQTARDGPDRPPPQRQSTDQSCGPQHQSCRSAEWFQSVKTWRDPVLAGLKYSLSAETIFLTCQKCMTCIALSMPCQFRRIRHLPDALPVPGASVRRGSFTQAAARLAADRIAPGALVQGGPSFQKDQTGHFVAYQEDGCRRPSYQTGLDWVDREAARHRPEVRTQTQSETGAAPVVADSKSTGHRSARQHHPPRIEQDLRMAPACTGPTRPPAEHRKCPHRRRWGDWGFLRSSASPWMPGATGWPASETGSPRRDARPDSRYL